MNQETSRRIICCKALFLFFPENQRNSVFFTASASFTAGVLLTVVGTETIRKVHKPSKVVFAFIPVFFAFQQFCEGVLWLCIGRTGYALLQSVMTHFFMIMAQMIWPVLVPLSVLLMEENKARKKIILYALLAGAVTAFDIISQKIKGKNFFKYYRG